LNSMRESNEMMRTLQASMSHDMRAPLQSISTAVELVLQSGRIPEDIMILLSPVSNSAKLLKL
jgi:light-regulated signal transduction histidine kinase (bacteriophytochrome)